MPQPGLVPLTRRAPLPVTEPKCCLLSSSSSLHLSVLLPHSFSLAGAAPTSGAWKQWDSVSHRPIALAPMPYLCHSLLKSLVYPILCSIYSRNFPAVRSLIAQLNLLHQETGHWVFEKEFFNHSNFILTRQWVQISKAQQCPEYGLVALISTSFSLLI